MKNRKFLAVLLSVALLVGILPIAGFSLGAVAEETTYTVYVSASGNDTAAGTAEAPLATLAAAVSAIEADTATKGIINIVGAFTISSANSNNKMTAHTKPITIQQADSSASLTISSQLTLGGPLTIDNITVNTADNVRIVCLRHAFSFGSGVTMVYTSNNLTYAPRIIGGAYAEYPRVDAPARESLVLNGGSYNRVHFGNSATATNYYTNSAGGDVVMNATQIYQLWLGADGWASDRLGYTNYTGDLNFVMNKGILNQIVLSDAGTASKHNGNAIQLVFNNGTGVQDTTTLPTAEAVEAKGGKLYILNCAAQSGSSLMTTDTEGVYTVNGDMMAVATGSDGTVAKSENGVLAVPKADTYSVAWLESTEPTVVYVDATNGADTNNGALATPFATLNAAITALGGVTNPYGKIVRIIGAYTVDAGLSLTTHTDMITIEGAPDTSATLTLNKHISTIGGPLTVDNIALAGTGTFRARTYKLVFGSGVTYNTNTSKASLPNITTGATYGGHVTTAGQVEELTVNSGGYSTIYLGNAAVTSGMLSPSGGINFVMNGGYFYKLFIGTDGWDAWPGGTSYEGDVNLTINGGSFGLPSNETSPGGITVVNSTTVLNSDFNGNAVQVIFNNGTAGSFTDAMLPSAETVAAQDGVLYMLKCTAQPGSTLETTDTEGVYKVNGDLVAVATAEDGVTTHKSAGGVLTVPAGIYTVTWELDATPLSVYVDAASGRDENDGLTETTAVATLNKAIELIEASNKASGIVTIIGTVDNPGALAEHSKMITFRGQTPATDGILNVNGMRLKGPTTFENIYLTNGSVRADGYELVIGENVTTPQYPYVSFYSGTYDSSNTARRDTATLKSGRFNQGYLGPFYCVGAAESTLGVDYVQTGGTVTYLTLGGDAWSAASPVFYETIYKGDVNIAINGGQVGEIQVLKPISDSNGNRVNRDTVFEGAVQIVINGEGYMTNALPAIDAPDGVWLMNGRNDGGYALEITDEAGTFTVNTADVTAIAYDAAGNIYQSEGGTLTVPAGTYTVEYQTDLSYTNTGSKIKFYADTTVDFATLAHDEPDGQMFVGWVDAEGNAPASSTFAAGDVLTAQYVAYTADDFAFLGSSIRFSDDKTQKDLRYMFQLNNVLKGSELITDVSYGAVAIPNSMLTVNNASFTTSAGEVKLGGVYRYNGTDYNVAQVKAEKTWATTADGVQYTLCLTGITTVRHETRYAVRGYMTYTDMNGVAQELYSAEASESLVSTAKRVLTELGVESDEAADFSTLIANAKVALQEKYTSDGSIPVSIDVSTAPVGSDGEAGIVRRSDGTVAQTIYQLAGTGLVAHDVVIDGVGETYSEAVTVVQVTDPHLHAYNDEDMAENNPTTMASKIYRTHNNLNYGFDYAQKAAIVTLVNAMEYASAYGDQIMVTGDVIDVLTLGSLELMDRYIEIAYPEAISLLGNHEPVRQWQHDVVDASSLDSRYKLLQENWNHDVYYTSRVVEDKVMVIQLDNGQEKFWASQQPLLAADLATARENGYTVLIFTHVPLSTLDSADTAIATLRGADEGSTYDIYNKGVGKSDSTGVMELIVNNADIIKGVFNGHTHSDYYTEIAASTADGTATFIPQYTLHGNFYESGNVLKITVQ